MVVSSGVGKYAKKTGGWLTSSLSRRSAKKSASDVEDQGGVVGGKSRTPERSRYTDRITDPTAISVVKREGGHRWRQLGRALLGSYIDNLERVLRKKPSDEDRVEYILERWIIKMGTKATIKELLNVCDRSDIDIKRAVWSGLVSVPVVKSDGEDNRSVSLRQSANLHFLKVGRSVKLHCKATGSGDPVTYQWYFNDDFMTGESKETVEVMVGGLYHCVVSGTFGSKTGDTMEVFLVRQLASDRVAAQGTEALLEYYRSNKLIVTAPEEILALGSKVQRAFLEAIRTNGCVRCPRVRLMIVGQDRAGKTSLVKALLNALNKHGSMPRSTDSTSGIDISLVKCHLDDDECVFEAVEGLESEVQTIKRLQARHVAELILQQSAMPKKDSSVDGPEPSVQPDAAKELSTATEEEPSNAPLQSDKIEASNQQDEELSQHWKMQLDEEMGILVSQELKAMREGQRPVPRNRLSSSDLSNSLWLRLYDFAGQPIYYNTHACFMTSHGVYIIVHNLEKNLDDPAVVCVGRHGKEFIIEAGCGTNRDYLQTWMTAVSITEPVTSSAITMLTPSALMVGTHYDIIRKYYPNLSERSQFLSAKEAAIEAVVNRFPLSRHFRRPFFYVDNLFSCDDAEDQLVCLRRKIVDLAMEDKQSEGLIPFSWLRFEVDVYTEAPRNPDGYWSYSEAIERASRCFSLRNLGGEEHLQSMFEFYHRLGVIMWFGESVALTQYVVINPQLLLNLFRSVISLDPALDDRKTFWKQLRNTGVLEYEHVDSMLSESISANTKTTPVESRGNLAERKEFLLKMLQMFGLTVPYLECMSAVKKFRSGLMLKSSRFLIPSMVSQVLPAESFAQQLDGCPTVYLTSLHGLVPAALYNRLVVYLVRLFPLSPAVYRQFARLHIDRNTDLLLFSGDTEQGGRIKLVVQSLASGAAVVPSVQPSEILQYVVQAIADIKSQGMRGLQFVVEAEVTCNGTEPVHHHFFPVFQSECSKHSLQSCADPGCLDTIIIKCHNTPYDSGVHVRCGVNQCPNELVPPESLDQWWDSWTKPANSKVCTQIISQCEICWSDV